MNKKKPEWRIIEQHNKFYVERLSNFLFCKIYLPMWMESKSENSVRFFLTLDQAKDYIEGSKIKYHYYPNVEQRVSSTKDEKPGVSVIPLSPKIRVCYATEFGGQITILELSELKSFIEKFKILSLEWES